MSLYNTLFGFNPSAALLLNMLKITPSMSPRFRDCFLKENTIVIYTRTGGGNREAYKAQNQWLRTVSGFVTDYDDSFDSTFAYFVYTIPEKYLLTCEVLREYGAEKDPRTQMENLLAKMKDPSKKNDPEVLAALEKMAPTMERLKEAIKNGGGGIISI